MANQFHARERRKSLYDPSYELFRTHQFAYNETAILTGTRFPDRTKPVTFSVTTRITAGSPTGIILELGSATVGLALWYAVADGKIYAAAGDAAAADGVTLAGSAPPAGQKTRIVFSVIPASGKARLWINGKLVAADEATNGEFPNGWADTASGAVGAVGGAVTTRVPMADRITLADVDIISPVNVFQNQRPRQFFEVD